MLSRNVFLSLLDLSPFVAVDSCCCVFPPFLIFFYGIKSLLKAGLKTLSDNFGNIEEGSKIAKQTKVKLILKYKNKMKK